MNNVGTDAELEVTLAAVWTKGNGALLLPYLLGAIFDWIMLGVIMGMSVQWAQHRKEERAFTRICVGISLISALASSIYLIIFMCKAFVWGFGTYREFAYLHWTSQYSICFDWSTTAIQLFYTERAYRLNKNAIWIPIAVIPVMIVTWIIHIYSVVYINSIYTYSGPEIFSNKLTKAGFYMWLSAAIYINTLITSSIAFALYRNRTGWKTTDSIIVRLIWVSLETQLPGLIISTVLLSTFGDREVGIIFVFSQPKVYIIGLLACVNFRFAHRGNTSNYCHGQHVYPLEISDPTRGSRSAGGDTGQKRVVQIDVDVDTLVFTSQGSSQTRSTPNRPMPNRVSQRFSVPAAYENGPARLAENDNDGFAAGSSETELNVDWGKKEIC